MNNCIVPIASNTERLQENRRNMDGNYQILYIMLVLFVFLISMCGLLNRLRNQYYEYITALAHQQVARQQAIDEAEQLPEYEAYVIEMEKGNIDNDDLPPKYEEVIKGRYDGLPAVHHI